MIRSLNGKSLGRKQKKPGEYRLRWDDVIYQSGELKVVAYRDGKQWSSDRVVTSGAATHVVLTAEDKRIAADGVDLAFIQAKVVDNKGQFVANANSELMFSVDGPGEIVATDNGDPTNLASFKSLTRSAFNGLCLVIVRALPGKKGKIKVTAAGEGIARQSIDIDALR